MQLCHKLTINLFIVLVGGLTDQCRIKRLTVANAIPDYERLEKQVVVNKVVT